MWLNVPGCNPQDRFSHDMSCILPFTSFVYLVRMFCFINLLFCIFLFAYFIFLWILSHAPINHSKKSLNFYSLPASDNFASSFVPPEQAGQKQQNAGPDQPSRL